MNTHGGLASIGAQARSHQRDEREHDGATPGNGNVTLQATGNLTVAANAVVNSGSGTLTLAADVAAGAGDDGVGVLTIAAGALVESANASSSAITLHGADMNIQGAVDSLGAPSPSGLVRPTPQSTVHLGWRLTPLPATSTSPALATTNV